MTGKPLLKSHLVDLPGQEPVFCYSLFGDPADQIIVATAREENATILSKDQLIRDYQHARCVW